MKEGTLRISVASGSTWCVNFAVLALFALVSRVASGQSVPTSASIPISQLPDAPDVQDYQTQTAQSQQVDHLRDVALPPAHSEPLTTPTGDARVITLLEAQEKAAPANSNPMVCLGQLQVEVARQTRLGTMSTFFPQIGSRFTNFRVNKFSELLQVTGPLGTTRTAALPLAGKDQTLIAVTATQPITPLFQSRELYKINLADERIARAKAGMPVPETTSKVENAYYELLVAQRQMDFTKVKAAESENKWLVASGAAIPVASAGHDEELIENNNALASATTKEKESRASLNELLGWPADMALQLVPPDPGFEEISLKEATDKALVLSPEVIEAEQNVVKARSAATLQKLSYAPVVAAMGGYAYNSNAVPLLPGDFSFVQRWAGARCHSHAERLGPRRAHVDGQRSSSQALQPSQTRVTCRQRPPALPRLALTRRGLGSAREAECISRLAKTPSRNSGEFASSFRLDEEAKRGSL